MGRIRFIKDVTFNADEDLRLIRAILSGKVFLMSQKQPIIMPVRLYLLDPLGLPLVIFDGVDYFDYIEIWSNRNEKVTPDEKKILRIAAFIGKECAGLDWIGTKAAICLCVFEAAHRVMNPSDPDGSVRGAIRRVLDRHKI